MLRALHSFLILLSLFVLSLSAAGQEARELLLRLAPEAEAPVIARVNASEKVILDAAPAPGNAERGWRQLTLPTPFEGYVPTATLGKDLAITIGTPVHYLPTANAAQITRVEPDDRYEIVRTHDEWVTVRFEKTITGYFLDEPGESITLDLSRFNNRQSPQEPLARNTPAPAAEALAPAEPLTIPAPRARINPDQPIARTDPATLPPENVSWRPARSHGSRGSESEGESESRTVPHHAASQTHRSSESEGGRMTSPIMVTPDQTQAREAAPDFGPAKAPRLLTGTLVREVRTGGADYPIRLRSPEGRLIAYVDLSGIYIADLSPYLNQKVYLRGQIHPLPGASSQLVMLAEEIRLAE
jgi:hypothetical protein